MRRSFCESKTGFKRGFGSGAVFVCVVGVGVAALNRGADQRSANEGEPAGAAGKDHLCLSFDGIGGTGHGEPFSGGRRAYGSGYLLAYAVYLRHERAD